MKKDIAEMWIEALRSGKYKQGYGYLKQESGDNIEENARFCCLGVLCSITDPLHLSKNTESLSQDIMNIAGVENYLGYIPSIDNSLVKFNDADKLTFPEIADIIEKHWEKL